MGLFDSPHRRMLAGEERKEDIKIHLNIHNDDSLGSAVFFEEPQISLFGEIILAADDFFETCPPESEKYDFTGLCNVCRIPIYLIPEREICIWNKCSEDEKAFREDMKKRYENELEKIKQWPSEEQGRRKELLRKKYGPWLCDLNCDNCKGKLVTPLGFYLPEGKVFSANGITVEGEAIFICLERIRKISRDKKINEDALCAKVLLHELAHARMYNADHPSYKSPFDYWVEESLANKIALKYLAVASKLMNKTALFDDAKSVVAGQSDAYALGLYLLEHNASDWNVLQSNKKNINESIADQWVEAVCDKKHRNIGDIQRLFYSAFDKPAVFSSASGFEAWLAKATSLKTKTSQQNYLSFVTSEFIGQIFRQIMGWNYRTVSECNSIDKIQSAIDAMSSSPANMLFQKALFGNATSALKQYLEYLKYPTV